MIAFLTLSVLVLDDKRENMKPVALNFLPETIVAYHPNFDGDQTFIYLNTGSQFCIDLPIESYEASIKAYWEQLKNRNKLKIN
jgi:hypothetical protein